MPTGYTADVGEGKVTEFAQYASQCMRAFGACVLMRDEPWDAPIKEFEPSDYHAKALRKANDELDVLRRLSAEERQSMAASAYEDGLKQWREYNDRKNLTRSRYESMLEKAKSFKSPGPDHDEFAKFLVEQLTESIECDCSIYEEVRPKQLSPDEWYRKRLKACIESIEYHTEQNQKEIESAKTRNEWVKKAREAISRVGSEN